MTLYVLPQYNDAKKLPPKFGATLNFVEPTFFFLLFGRKKTPMTHQSNHEQIWENAQPMMTVVASHCYADFPGATTANRTTSRKESRSNTADVLQMDQKPSQSDRVEHFSDSSPKEAPASSNLVAVERVPKAAPHQS